MKPGLFPWLFLMVQLAQGQSIGTKREVAYFDIRSDVNYYRNLNLQDELFKGAKEGKIKLYHFESFNQEPKEISYSGLQEIIETQLLSSFQKWSPRNDYRQVRYVRDDYGRAMVEPASKVVYNNHLFEARVDHKKKRPTDTTYWMPATPELHFDIVGLDYFIQTRDTTMQFLHFFLKDAKYVVSLKANEVQSFLNSSNRVWFPTESDFASHVVGNLFLFDSWDKPTIKKDLWPFLDTIKLKVKWPVMEAYGTHTLEQLNTGKVTAFAIAFENSIYDRIPISKISKFIEQDKKEFFLLGDAIVDFNMFPIKKSTSKKEFQQLRTLEKIEKAQKVTQLQLVQTENFDFKTQNNKIIDEIYGLIHQVFEGVSENKIRVYKDEKLQDYYSPNELVKFWSRHTLEEWNEKYYYSTEETVIYKNEYYTSIANNNRESPENTNWWEKGKVTIVQPEFAKSMEFITQTIFDCKGVVLEKKYSSVKMSRLGYFQYNEIKDYIQLTKPVLWKNIFKWIEENGLYDVTPVSLTKQK